MKTALIQTEWPKDVIVAVEAKHLFNFSHLYEPTFTRTKIVISPPIRCIVLI
jgi:hypothetical protein